MKNLLINAMVGHYQETPLFFTARIGHTDMVNILLKKGADMNARTNEEETALILAAGCGITNSEYRTTCFDYAEKRNFLNTVNSLLEKGAKVNAKSKKGFTALNEIVKIFEKAGATR